MKGTFTFARRTEGKGERPLQVPRSTPAFPDFDVDESDVDFAWGIGVQARFGSLGARLEYENFSIIEDEELGTVSLSFTYTFL